MLWWICMRLLIKSLASLSVPVFCISSERATTYPRTALLSLSLYTSYGSLIPHILLHLLWLCAWVSCFLWLWFSVNRNNETIDTWDLGPFICVGFFSECSGVNKFSFKDHHFVNFPTLTLPPGCLTWFSFSLLLYTMIYLFCWHCIIRLYSILFCFGLTGVRLVGILGLFFVYGPSSVLVIYL